MFLIGQTLRGRYSITTKLGEGTFGETYLAIDNDQPNNYQCVIKRLKPQNLNQTTIQWLHDSFEREASILQKLGTNHTQIPSLLAFFSENQNFFIVQEFIQGFNLRAEFSIKRQYHENEVLFLLQDILEVLEYVQSQGVIHRDLKPENLMRRRKDSKIVLIDFGAMKEIGTQIFNSRGQISSSTVVIGTPGYMPIEQLHRRPMFCSDIYALGMIVLEALSGIFPAEFIDSYTGEVIWRDRIQIRSDFAKVLDKMIAYDVGDRYRCASEVLEDVRKLTKTVIRPPISSSIPIPDSSFFVAKSPSISTNQYAGFWRRLAAYCIDFSILIVCSCFLSFTNNGNIQDAAEFAGNIFGYYIILAFVYSPVMESYTTQATLGKMALGIIVTDIHGKRISWGKANLRHFSKILSHLCFWIGFFMAGFTHKKQTLHDKLSNCLVLRKD
jgi:eukaryotic-like serine/threonine-protein kinase